MTIESFIGLFGIMMIASVTPGPSTLYVFEVSTKHSYLKAIQCILAIAISAILYATMALLGLSALMLKYAMIYRALKILGGVYLVYLGIRKIISIKKMKMVDTEVIIDTNKSPVRQAALIGLSNPKVIIFFASIFPQFIPANLTISVFILLLASVLISCFICLFLYVIVGKRLLRFTKNLKAMKIFEGLSGVLYAAFGTVLLLDR